MTLSRWDKFAFVPKRCDKCNRLFWLEFYKISIEKVGIEDFQLEWITCKECVGKGNANDG